MNVVKMINELKDDLHLLCIQKHDIAIMLCYVATIYLNEFSFVETLQFEVPLLYFFPYIETRYR